MWFRRRDTFARDVAGLAAIADLDPAEVRGFFLVLYLRGGQAAFSSNACCTRHALVHLARLTEQRTPGLVFCSGEE